MKIQELHVNKIFISLSLVAIAVSGCSKSNAVSEAVASLLPRGDAKGERASFPAMANSEQWQVIRVSDGDTIAVRQGQREIKIRFCGIDAPEKVQPLGKESKANLQKLVDEVGGRVLVTPIESDRYGRMVAEVFSSLDGIEKNFNEEQVSSGLAMVYPSYVKKCPNKIAFGNAEEIAKNKRLGVWGDSSTVPPWEFRKQQRQNNGN